jgi:hypothetical protein
MNFEEARIRAIIEGPKRFRIIPFPGAEGVKVAVRCLTEAELDGCRIEAQLTIRKTCKPREWDPASYVNVDPEALDRLWQRQIVWRAFYDSDTVNDPAVKPVRFFPADADVGELDSVTVTRLMEAYAEHQQWVSPTVDLNQESIKALIEELKKTPKPEVLLSGFGLLALQNLCISLALQMPKAD